MGKVVGVILAAIVLFGGWQTIEGIRRSSAVDLLLRDSLDAVPRPEESMLRREVERRLREIPIEVPSEAIEIEISDRARQDPGAQMVSRTIQARGIHASVALTFENRILLWSRPSHHQATRVYSTGASLTIPERSIPTE